MEPSYSRFLKSIGRPVNTLVGTAGSLSKSFLFIQKGNYMGKYNFDNNYICQFAPAAFRLISNLSDVTMFIRNPINGVDAAAADAYSQLNPWKAFELLGNMMKAYNNRDQQSDLYPPTRIQALSLCVMVMNIDPDMMVNLSAVSARNGKYREFNGYVMEAYKFVQAVYSWEMQDSYTRRLFLESECNTSLAERRVQLFIYWDDEVKTRAEARSPDPLSIPTFVPEGMPENVWQEILDTEERPMIHESDEEEEEQQEEEEEQELMPQQKPNIVGPTSRKRQRGLESRKRAKTAAVRARVPHVAHAVMRPVLTIAHPVPSEEELVATLKSCAMNIEYAIGKPHLSAMIRGCQVQLNDMFDKILNQ